MLTLRARRSGGLLFYAEREGVPDWPSDHSHLPRQRSSSYSLIGYRSENMRPWIIGASVALALTHLGPALGEDANHILPGCRAAIDDQSFNDTAEARECLGIIEGMRVGATL